MSDPVSSNMICPKCGRFQPRAETCDACGVVIAKLREGIRVESAQPEQAAASSNDGSRIPAQHEAPRLTAVTRVVAGVVGTAIGVVETAR